MAVEGDEGRFVASERRKRDFRREGKKGRTHRAGECLQEKKADSGESEFEDIHEYIYFFNLGSRGYKDRFGCKESRRRTGGSRRRELSQIRRAGGRAMILTFSLV